MLIPEAFESCSLGFPENVSDRSNFSPRKYSIPVAACYIKLLHFVFVLSYTGRLGPKFKKQLGKTKSIRFGVIPVPVGIFLEMTAQGTAEVSVSLNKDIL